MFHFHDTSASAALRRTARVNDNRLAFLYFLRERRQDSYNLIQETVRLAAPFFDRLVLEPNSLNPERISLEWKHQETDAYFDASSLSDGSLRFMALATLLLQPLSFDIP